MIPHRHKLGHWFWRGPECRARVCLNKNCKCDRDCCMVEDNNGRWKNKKWVKNK